MFVEQKKLLEQGVGKVGFGLELVVEKWVVVDLMRWLVVWQVERVIEIDCHL